MFKLLFVTRDMKNCKSGCFFNAGVILSDEEVRQLTESGCEIYPIQWIEVDKNARQRNSNDFTTVPPKYESRLVGCGNVGRKNKCSDGHSEDIVKVKYRKTELCTEEEFACAMGL